MGSFLSGFKLVHFFSAWNYQRCIAPRQTYAGTHAHTPSHRDSVNEMRDETESFKFSPGICRGKLVSRNRSLLSSYEFATDQETAGTVDSCSLDECSSCTLYILYHRHGMNVYFKRFQYNLTCLPINSSNEFCDIIYSCLIRAIMPHHGQPSNIFTSISSVQLSRH